MKRLTKKLALEYLKSFWSVIAIYTLVNILSRYIEIYIVKFVGNASDKLFKKQWNILSDDIYILILLIIISIVILPALEYIWKKKLTSSGVEYDSDFYNKVLKQKRNMFDKQDQGQLIYRTWFDPCKFRISILTLGNGIIFIFTMILTLVIMIRINIKFTVVCILLSSIPVIIPIVTKNKIKAFYKQVEVMNGEVITCEKKLINNIAYTKATALNEYSINFLNKVFKRAYEKTIKKKIFYDRCVEFFNEFFEVFCQILICIIGSYFIAMSYITVGEAIEFFGLSYIIKDSVNVFTIVIRHYYEFDVAAERINELTSNNEVSGTEKLNDINSIKIRDLTFGYGDKIVINDVNLEVLKGEHVLIRGKNGCGKSTLIKLLVGLYTDYDGEILLNDSSLKNLDINSIRNLIAVVPQKPFILNASIYDNLKIFAPNADEQKIEDVLIELNLYDIKDKIAGDNGALLSGGEKQKISFARVLLRETQIVIMDEPVNSLDLYSQQVTEKFIEQTSKTLIVISHDFSLKHEFNKVIEI